MPKCVRIFFFLISLRWRMAEGRQAARCRDMRTHIDAEREIGERERVRFHVALQTSKHIYLHELQRNGPAQSSIVMLLVIFRCMLRIEFGLGAFWTFLSIH